MTHQVQLHREVQEALYASQGASTTPVYIIVQQTAPEPSWLRQHGGQLVVAGGAGTLVVALLLAVAVVAVAVGIGAVSCAIGWLVIKTLMGSQTQK